MTTLSYSTSSAETKYNKKNGHDCGVFACLFADFIAMDCAPIFDFDEECINKCRELIALAIMNECAIDYNLNVCSCDGHSSGSFTIVKVIFVSERGASESD
eukprot:scaffold13767_cov80-Skeletonema_menzelii.AAC.1